MKEHQRQIFDEKDIANEGRPLWWDEDHHCFMIESMVICDEVEMALKMCDMVPGWYRDNKSKKIEELRSFILKRLYSAQDYIDQAYGIEDTSIMTKEQFNETYFATSRGMVIHNLVKALNEKGNIPHIFEMGPANYMLPNGLLKNGRKFTYNAKSVNTNIDEMAKARIGSWWSDQPRPINIFVCYEVIEHLWNPDEIYQNALKSGFDFDYILISTPKYTYAGGNYNWQNSSVGHLRTYTPNELLTWCMRNFPNRMWTRYDSDLTIMMGQKPESMKIPVLS